MNIIKFEDDKQPSTLLPFPYNPPKSFESSGLPKTFHLPPKPYKSSKYPIITVTEDELLKHDTDLWLIFDNPRLKTPPHGVVLSLKNQFESTNIVKISQAFHLETSWNPEDILITGWKLHDPSLLYSIITKTKPLSFSYNGFPLNHYLIGTVGQLQRFLKQRRQDEKLNKSELFTQEYAKPLLSLHLQGLFYYEFDYIDIAPDTLCILCGVPSNITDENLTTFITQNNNVPAPVNILRNPLEGVSNVRIAFPEASDVDLFKFQGFQVPITGNFSSFKPIIILPVTDRGFDLGHEIAKYQILLSFEEENEVETKAQIQVLKQIENKYGSVSDVTVIFSKLWVVSFEGINSAVRCLEGTNKESFSLRVAISKPAKPYPCSGFLFQQKNLPLHDTQMPERPAKLVKTDPKSLKIKTPLFGKRGFFNGEIDSFFQEKSLLLKRRYQKIYSRQLEESKNGHIKENDENVEEEKLKEKEAVKMKRNRRKKAKARKVVISKEKHQSSWNEFEFMEELREPVLTCKKVKINSGDEKVKKKEYLALEMIRETELKYCNTKNAEI